MIPDITASERAFIGALLNSPTVYWEAKTLVRAEMLTQDTHRQIYDVIGSLMDAGRNVTRSALEARLPAEYGDGEPFMPLVMVLKENAADAGSAMDYAEAIREDFARKELIKAAQAAVKACKDPSKMTSDIIANLEAHLMDATRQSAGSTIITLGAAAQEALKRTNDNYQCKDTNKPVGLRSGVAEIDRLLGPIMGGDMVVIAARSGEGKTTLALQIMQNVSRGDHAKPTLLISQEMTSTQIAMRFLASRADVSVRDQRSGEIDIFNFQKLQDAAIEAQGVNVYIDDCGRQRTSAICSKIRAFHRQHGLGCAAIDHIRLVRTDNPKWGNIEVIEHASMAFKDLAKELDIPILLLVQLTRGSQEKATTHRFTDQAIFGGDAIKQACDAMLGVTLPRKWLKHREPDESDTRAHDDWVSRMERWRDKAEVGALKMRDDDDGQWVQLPFDGSTYTFGTIAT